MKNSWITKFYILIIIASFLIGCGGSAGEEGPELGDRALFNAGLKYMQEEDYKAAILVFNTFEANFPNSIYYQQVRLKRADSLFKRNMRSVFIEAEAEYKAYITLYPSSENLDYVQKQIALCHWKRKRSYKNDQAETKRTIEELELFIKKYPDSKYMEEVNNVHLEAKEHLSKHESYIGEFYTSIGEFHAGERRFVTALDLAKQPNNRYKYYANLLDALQKQDKKEEISKILSEVIKELEKTESKTAEYILLSNKIKSLESGSKKK